MNVVVKMLLTFYFAVLVKQCQYLCFLFLFRNSSNQYIRGIPESIRQSYRYTQDYCNTSEAVRQGITAQKCFYITQFQSKHEQFFIADRQKYRLLILTCILQKYQFYTRKYKTLYFAYMQYKMYISQNYFRDITEWNRGNSL